MDTINGFELTYNDYLHLHAESEVEFNHLELKKHAMEALLTDIVWSLRTEQEPLDIVVEAAAWFKDNRADLAARFARDGNGQEAGSGGIV